MPTVCRALLPSVVLLAGVVGAEAGSLSGTVRARGAESGAGGGADGGYGSRRFKFVERVNYDELTDFFVYIDQPVEESGPPRAPAHAVMVRQRDATFEPRIIAVAPGTVVEFPNEDEIYHNVFSISEVTPFDLGLYRKGEATQQVRFDQPGRVDVFCSIHTKMSCIVLVVPSRFFARADGRGRWKIDGVPAGKYRLKAWHERMPSRTVEVDVPGEGTVSLDLVLGFGVSRDD